MSWDGYIDSITGGSADAAGKLHCDKAAIIGLEGGASWTSNTHAAALKLVGKEGENIANAMNKDDSSLFQASGIMCEGKKYQFLRQDGNAMYGKMKGHGCLTISKSRTAVVIAHTGEGCQHGNSNKAVATIIEYLENMQM